MLGARIMKSSLTKHSTPPNDTAKQNKLIILVAFKMSAGFLSVSFSWNAFLTGGPWLHLRVYACAYVHIYAHAYRLTNESFRARSSKRRNFPFRAGLNLLLDIRADLSAQS